MNRLKLPFLLSLGLLFFSNILFSQDLETLKNQKESLKLHLDLVNKQINLEEQKIENEKLQKLTAELNSKSDKKADNYNPSNAETTAKEAKKAAKILKQAENANKELSRSNDKIIDLEADLKKINNKIEKLKLKIEYKD